MTWTDPTGDLRILLGDDSASNQVKDKAVFPFSKGTLDGTCSTFVTLEDRLVTASGSQAGLPHPVRVFLRSVANQSFTEVPSSGIYVTDPVRGEFTVTPTPSGVTMAASYFWEQYLDSDLAVCLQQAAQQVNVGNATQVQPGLQLAALDIAASLAHRKAAQRWAFRKTMQFLLEDVPAQEQIAGMVAFHTEQAKELMDAGLASRAAFYDLRQDQGRAPAYRLLSRTPWPYTPRR